MTGQTPARNGSTAPEHHLPEVRMKADVAKTAPAGNKARQSISANRLDANLPTLGKLVCTKGYRTAHFGKWHLGPEPYSPLEHGFEVDIPHWPGPSPAGNFVAPWKYPAFKPNKPDEHIEDRMAEEAVKWMRGVADQPFYMNYWMFSVHAPFDAKKELIEKYRKKVNPDDPQRCATYAAMVESMDDAVGTLLNELNRLKIADRTVIIFYSDNGGNMYDGIPETDAKGAAYVTEATSNRPLRGGKATMFEGGIRVPCVVVWPGVAKPGSRSEALIQSTDLYPFILNLLKIPLPEKYAVDGVDFSPALRDEPFDRGPIFTYFPHSPGVPDWLPPSVAVHSGDWKLIRQFHQGENGAHSYLLYNLKEDIGETNNLASVFPEKVQALDRLIEGHLKDAQAVVPQLNPDFDPAQYRPEEVGVQKGGLKAIRGSKGSSPAKKAAGAPLRPSQGNPSAGGWQAKSGGTVALVADNGELVVNSTGNDPWLMTKELSNQAGPFTLEFEIWAAQSGDVQVFVDHGDGFERGSGINSPVKDAGQWLSGSVAIPGTGKLKVLRIDPPGGAGKTRLRNMQLTDEKGKMIQSWSF
jgi:arylsulfatase A-like enzyme